MSRGGPAFSEIEKKVWADVYSRTYQYAMGSTDIVRWAIMAADAAVIHLRSAIDQGIGFRSDTAAIRLSRKDLTVTSNHRRLAWRFLNDLRFMNESHSPELSQWIKDGGDFDLRHEEAAVSFAEAELISSGKFPLILRSDP